MKTFFIVAPIVLVVIGVVLAIIYYISSKKKQSVEKTVVEKVKITPAQFRKVDSKFEEDFEKNMCFEYFKMVEKAITKRDLKVLRKCTGDNLYEKIANVIVDYDKNNLVDVIEHIKLVDCEITDLIKINEKEEYIQFNLEVTLNNYLIDANKEVFKGNKDTIYDIVYTVVLLKNIEDNSYVMTKKVNKSQKTV